MRDVYSGAGVAMRAVYSSSAMSLYGLPGEMHRPVRPTPIPSATAASGS